MSGLFSTLNSSVQALNAQSIAIDVTGKNLANINNPNYARQRVLIGEGATVVTANGAQSLGLQVEGIQSLRNNLLDQQVVHASSLSSYYQTMQTAYQQAQAGLNEGLSAASASSGAGNTTGLNAALGSFFNSFQSLAANPTDPGTRQTLIQNAATLAATFNQTDGQLAQLQSDLNTQVTSDVSTANNLLQSIAGLNKQISAVEIGHPGSAVDLRDQRQSQIEQLATYLPVSTAAGVNGMVQVVMKDSSNADVLLVDGASVTGPVAATATGVTGGASASALQLGAGSIGGEFAARDGAIKDARDSITALAKQLVTSVNAAYNPSGTGANFFNPAGTTAGTIALASGLTATGLVAGTGAAGDNSIALAVAAISSRTFSTGSGDAFDGTMGQYYSSAVSNFGQALSTTNNNVTNQSGVLSIVTSQRNSVSGVSLDEELANLTTYQRSYQASSRVFSIVDSLLDTVVNHLGA